mgnify:FL=1
MAISDAERAAFAAWVTETYGDVMETGTDHVGVVVVESDPQLGRADDADPVALVNADIRAGRSVEQRHALARRLTAELGDRFSVPGAFVYVVFTEHAGADFVLDGNPLEDWDGEEGADPGVGDGVAGTD